MLPELLAASRPGEEFLAQHCGGGHVGFGSLVVYITRTSEIFGEFEAVFTHHMKI